MSGISPFYNAVRKPLSRVISALFSHMWWTVGALALIGVALPLGSGQYFIGVYILTIISAISVSGYDFVLGYVREIHLAQAAFFAIAGYTSGILMVDYHVPFVIAGVVGVGLSVGFALLIGYLTLRMSELYFALASLALAEMARLILKNLSSVTGGTLGLIGIPEIGIGGMRISTNLGYYYFVLVVVAALLFYKYVLISSEIGDALTAIGKNEELAKSVGINTYKYKQIAFSLNAVYTGIAGVIYAHYVGLMLPEEASLIATNDALMMSIIGGMGSLWGPVLGAGLLHVIPEVLRFAAGLRLFIYGIILILVILFIPDGLYGLVSTLRGDE